MVNLLTFSIGRLIVRCRVEVGRSDALDVDGDEDLPLPESARPVLAGRARRHFRRARNPGTGDVRALLPNSGKPYPQLQASQGHEDGRMVFRPLPAGSRSPLIGENCTVLLSDVVGFGARYRNDTDRRIVREALFGMTDAALQDIPGVRSEDRGDGLLTVIPPTVPTARVMSEVLEELPAALDRHNFGQPESARFQLRLAVSVGPVVSDAMGVSGEAIIIAARLVEAPCLKEALINSKVNLGIIVSPFVYEAVIRHIGNSRDITSYSQVMVEVKESATTAWMKLCNAVEAFPAAARPAVSELYLGPLTIRP
jgi:class 3 adenylate cyclase